MKNLDDRYVKDLKKEAEDVDLMIERMEEQIKTLTKAYGEELLQIEVRTDSIDLLEVELSILGEREALREEEKCRLVKLARFSFAFWAIMDGVEQRRFPCAHNKLLAIVARMAAQKLATSRSFCVCERRQTFKLCHEIGQKQTT